MSYRKADLTKGLFHQHKDGEPLPSAKVLYEIIELSRAILFPGYYGNSTINSRTINYHIGVNIESYLTCSQSKSWPDYVSVRQKETATSARSREREEAPDWLRTLSSKLPAMRRILATDVEPPTTVTPCQKLR